MSAASCGYVNVIVLLFCIPGNPNPQSHQLDWNQWKMHQDFEFNG